MVKGVLWQQDEISMSFFVCWPLLTKFNLSEIRGPHKRHPSSSVQTEPLFQSLQVLVGLHFQTFPKALALLCFCLFTGALTMSCALLVAISLTRIFIIVKVTSGH